MKEIVWTEIAESDLDAILHYLERRWTQRVIDRFKSKLRDKIDHIHQNPKQFPYLNKKRRFRKCVVTKHNTIIYKEFEMHIVLLRIFDTRQNPNKRIYE